jgi:hypothetical protein
MKKFDFVDIQRIRRDYYGVVLEITFKNRNWSKKLLRERLRSDPAVQKAALKVILEEHSKIVGQLDLFNENLKHQKGFAPREVKLIPTFEHLVKTEKPLDAMEVVSLGKFLPKYAEQIWLRILSNLQIKYRAQTFSTPRRSKKK